MTYCLNPFMKPEFLTVRKPDAKIIRASAHKDMCIEFGVETEEASLGRVLVEFMLEIRYPLHLSSLSRYQNRP